MLSFFESFYFLGILIHLFLVAFLAYIFGYIYFSFLYSWLLFLYQSLGSWCYPNFVTYFYLFLLSRRATDNEIHAHSWHGLVGLKLSRLCNFLGPRALYLPVYWKSFSDGPKDPHPQQILKTSHHFCFQISFPTSCSHINGNGNFIHPPRSSSYHYMLLLFLVSVSKKTNKQKSFYSFSFLTLYLKIMSWSIHFSPSLLSSLTVISHED